MNHTQEQRIPTIDPATSTLIELLTTNARLPYPLHMPLWLETQPGAELAIRAVGALEGMRLEEHKLGLYLWNKADRLVAVMYEQQPGRAA